MPPIHAEGKLLSAEEQTVMITFVTQFGTNSRHMCLKHLVSKQYNQATWLMTVQRKRAST